MNIHVHTKPNPEIFPFSDFKFRGNKPICQHKKLNAVFETIAVSLINEIQFQIESLKKYCSPKIEYMDIALSLL